MKLKAVLIGCGNIAGGYDLHSAPDAVMTHAKAYLGNPNIELVGAFDVNPSQVKEFCKTWKIPRAYSDLNLMLKECGADIVSICSPNETHFEIFQTAAVFNPKAILCEKPLAMTSEEAQKMISVAKEKGIVLGVNYIRRWDPTLLALQKRIQSGEFGELQTGRILYTKGVFHNASHGINLMESWFGPVKSVNVSRVISRSKDDLLSDFSLSFEKAPQIAFQALNADFYNHFEIDLYFSGARILIGKDILIDWAGSGVLGARKEEIKGTLHKIMGEVVGNLVQCVLNKAPLKMEAGDALETIKVCEQIRNKKV